MLPIYATCEDTYNIHTCQTSTTHYVMLPMLHVGDAYNIHTCQTSTTHYVMLPMLHVGDAYNIHTGTVSQVGGLTRRFPRLMSASRNLQWNIRAMDTDIENKCCCSIKHSCAYVDSAKCFNLCALQLKKAFEVEIFCTL